MLHWTGAQSTPQNAVKVNHSPASGGAPDGELTPRSVTPSPTTTPRQQELEDQEPKQVNPFVADITRFLWRYCEGSKEALVVLGADETDHSRVDEAMDEAQNTADKRHSEDRRQIEVACHKYRKAIQAEHEKWLTGTDAITEAHLNARKQELEVVKMHYSDPGHKRIAKVVDDCFKDFLQHAAKNGHPAYTNGNGIISQDKIDQAELARQEWTREVIRFTLEELRTEWAQGQKKLMQLLRKEMGEAQKEACDKLAKQANMWEQIAEHVRTAWSAELKRTQQKLDAVAGEYRDALRNTLEAELHHLKKHVSEQSEFFNREISEAIRAEEAEQVMHGTQLRKMRLALIKWRHDYVRDVRSKAADAAARRKLDDGDGSSGEMEKLNNCRKVLDIIWERLPAREDEIRGFLLRLEEAMPCNGQVLRLYEEYLGEHGHLAALDASDGGDGRADDGALGQTRKR